MSAESHSLCIPIHEVTDLLGPFEAKTCLRFYSLVSTIFESGFFTHILGIPLQVLGSLCTLVLAPFVSMARIVIPKTNTYLRWYFHRDLRFAARIELRPRLTVVEFALPRTRIPVEDELEAYDSVLSQANFLDLQSCRSRVIFPQVQLKHQPPCWCLPVDPYQEHLLTNLLLAHISTRYLIHL
jgi:hypothetical protein